MSKHNIVKATFAIVDDNNKIIADPDKGLSEDGIYEADHNGEGFTQINISAIESQGTVGWANGQIKRTAYGKSMPTIALTALDLDWVVNQKIKGYTQSASTGAWTLQHPKPHIAMIAESLSFNDVPIYECFNNISFVEEASNNATDNQNEADYSTALQGQVLAPLSKDIFLNAKGEQQPMIAVRADDKGFDLAKLYAETFGGYKLDVNTTTTTTTKAN